MYCFFIFFEIDQLEYFKSLVFTKTSLIFAKLNKNHRNPCDKTINYRI